LWTIRSSKKKFASAGCRRLVVGALPPGVGTTLAPVQLTKSQCDIASTAKSQNEKIFLISGFGPLRKAEPRST
jgi:hypothetical protein